MNISPFAGKPAQAAMLVNIPRLVTAYYTEIPDSSVPAQRVAFGTSGHRGSALDSAFNEWHVLAITQAICLYREQQQINGPLYLGMDTHALSAPAHASALEVLAANGVEVMIASGDEYTPTPAISHAILCYNRERKQGYADGVVITPSHNPPYDGGFKYNPPHGGPAESVVTAWIEAKANLFLENGLLGVKRLSYQQALRAATTHRHDYLGAYIGDLGSVLDMDAIRGAKLSMAVDPLGGAGVHYWGRIAERYGLNLTVVNTAVEADFRFMCVDWDGKIRMDPSSSYAMQGLINLKNRLKQPATYSRPEPFIAGICALSPAAISSLDAQVQKSARMGYRMLAVASGPDAGALTLLGLVTLYDPLRPDAKQLIAELRELGVSVKMLTGDSLAVAKEIAAGIGLTNIRCVSDLKPASAQTGAESINLMTAADGYAEVYPEDKYIVVQRLQAAGHVTGMTGDGVNDAPALRQAEVGIAVNTATDVAKGAASVILTEPGLTNILALVTQGRTIYQHILTWIMNKISRTILKAAFVVIAFLATGKFVVSAFDATLGTLLTFAGLPGLTALPWQQTLGIFVYAMISCLVLNDVLKVAMLKWRVPALCSTVAES